MAFTKTPFVERFWQKVRKTEDCWLWTAGVAAGYGAARGLDGKQTGAHRVAYELECGPIEDGKQVLHRCDVKLCVRPSHLFLGTQQDNMDDMNAKGRGARGKALNHREQWGTANPSAKLTEETVRNIKSMFSAGIAQAEIMRRTGATRANVWAIVHGKSWTHI